MITSARLLGTLGACALSVGLGCGPREALPRTATPGPTPRRAASPARRSPPPVARCASATHLTLPAHIRQVTAVGGYRLVTAGLRASERPPCNGPCPPLQIHLALVDGAGQVCWRVALPDEHRRGPAVHPGGTIFVAGTRHVYAVSLAGRRLATTEAPSLIQGPVALADGGAAFVDGEGAVLAFRPDGTRRYRRRPQTTARPLALTARPGGGLALAFPQEDRGNPADGVARCRRALPATAPWNGLACGPRRALWVWSARGAFHLDAQGQTVARLPPRAPSDGQVFAAAPGAGGLFYVLLAEQGFYPVKLLAVTAENAPHWSRPFTGARPTGCHLVPGPRHQLGILCAGAERGRAVVRDAEGITRFDEELNRPQLALLPDGAYAVAGEDQARDMSWRCRVRRYAAQGETFRTRVRAGRCPVLWSTGTGAVYLGTDRWFRVDVSPAAAKRR